MYEVIKYQSGTTWIKYRDVNLHVGYWSGITDFSGGRNRSNVERDRFVNQFIECGMNNLEIGNRCCCMFMKYYLHSSTINFTDPFFGKITLSNYDTTSGENWIEKSLPQWFIDDVAKMIRGSIEFDEMGS